MQEHLTYPVKGAIELMATSIGIEQCKRVNAHDRIKPRPPVVKVCL
jgi:hypothetical protein